MLLSKSKKNKAFTSQDMGYLQLSNTIDQSYHMHQYLLKKLQEVSQQQVQKAHQNKQKMTSIADKVSGFKQEFVKFGEECSNEWLSMYQELLYIINQIVTIYQIKIQKLQQNLNQAEQTKKNVVEENAALKEILQLKLKNQSSVTANNYVGSNTKRIKISDVIAQYQLNNSNDKIPMKPCDSNVISIMDMSQQQGLGIELSPSQISHVSKIDPHLISYQDFKSDTMENNTVQSKQLEFPPYLRENPTKREPLANYSASTNYKRENSSNSLCGAASVARKRSYEVTEPARSASKFDQLRRNLFNRKKSQRLI